MVIVNFGILMMFIGDMKSIMMDARVVGSVFCLFLMCGEVVGRGKGLRVADLILFDDLLMVDIYLLYCQLSLIEPIALLSISL